MWAIGYYRLPGPAGALLDATQGVLNSTLITVLGDNYAQHHGELATALGGPFGLNPDDYQGDFGGLMNAHHHQVSILTTESLLRQSFLVRRNRSPDEATTLPLIDRDGFLVNFLSPPASEMLAGRKSDAMRSYERSASTATPPPKLTTFEGFPDDPPLITRMDQVKPVMDEVARRLG